MSNLSILHRSGEPQRVALYVRQSVSHEEGIERGLAKIRDLAEIKKWEVVGEYVDDNVSAAKKRGPGTRWADLLRDAGDGKFDTVVAVDMDRLLRSLSDLLAILEKGVRIATVSGEIDTTTADGLFRAQMLAAVAEFEIRRKSERQKRGNDFRVRKGLPVVGGRRRFGFEADHLTLRLDEAEWIRFMYTQIAEGASLRSVARALNDAKVPCVTRGEWNSQRVAKIVVNPAYRGLVIHHKKAWPSTEIPPVVEDELAATVAAIMSDPARRKTPGPERTALLTGIATCGTCGSRMTSAGTKSRGTAIPLYACMSFKERTNDGKSHPAVRRSIADEAVRDEVFMWIAANENAEEMESSPRLTALLVEISGLRQRRILAQDLALVPGADVPAFKSKIAELGREIENIESAIMVERGLLARNGVLEQVRSAWWHRRGVHEYTFREEEALRDWPPYWNALPLEQRREIVRSMLTITIFPGRGPERIRMDWIGSQAPA